MVSNSKLIRFISFWVISLPGIRPRIFFFFLPIVSGSIFISVFVISAANSLALYSSPSSSTKPSSLACEPVKILPSANFLTSSTGIFLPSDTALVNWL